jgi:hypothetical protein
VSVSLQYEKKRVRDCCSSKRIFTYLLESTVTKGLLDEIKETTGLDMKQSEKMFIFTSSDGFTRLSGFLGHKTMRVILTNSDLEFNKKLESILSNYHKYEGTE